MANVGLVLLAFAFVFMCIALYVPSVRGINLVTLAFVFWIAAELFGGVGRLYFR